jgi:hypothetical protein
MNISNIADFADILEAFGVIGSLLFLALQVRYNTKTVRNQHYESHQDRFASCIARPLDQQVARVIDKGRVDFEALDGDEKIVFGAWAVEYLANISSIGTIARQGILNPDIAEMVDRRLKWFFRDRGTGQWLRDPARHPMPRGFEQVMNDVLLELWPETAKHGS